MTFSCSLLHYLDYKASPRQEQAVLYMNNEKLNERDIDFLQLSRYIGNESIFQSTKHTEGHKNIVRFYGGAGAVYQTFRTGLI